MFRKTLRKKNMTRLVIIEGTESDIIASKKPMRGLQKTHGNANVKKNM